MDPDLDPHSAIGYLLQHVSAAYGRQADQVLQERLGIGMSQYKILTILGQRPDIQQKQLADHLGQTEASVSRQLKLMHQKGLLVRHTNPNNRRAHITEPTPKGLTLAEAAHASLLHYSQPLLSQLTDKQQKQLIETLRQMHDWLCKPGNLTACDRPFGL